MNFKGWPSLQNGKIMEAEAFTKDYIPYKINCMYTCMYVTRVFYC